MSLTICDYSQIEARVVVWLAGGDLSPFTAEDADPYQVFGGRHMFDCDPTDVTGERRQKAKAAVLGCGFGCGGATLEKQFSYAVAPGEGAGIVSSWRRANPQVVRYWAGLERDLTRTLRRGTPHGPYRRTLSHTPYEYDIECVLPSGRCIYYRGVARERVMKWGEPAIGLTYYSSQYKVKGSKMPMRVGLYGGKLAENVTQAVARDIMAEALMRLDEAGLRPIMLTHDEVVCETDRGTDVQRLMETPPTWADGLPIAAPAKVVERYEK